ncbi:TorF family putative porin [Pseudomonas sp. 5P_3.1_Bac2]|uniref:TorF family putative porin n=1 Tax=Pseudomonas sp. 5P_3.1_Bac2 TaxID=2971617 RepID=UPI0021C75888|nr:TorF family putative porin [Pseudomonas sp. 5P_3.1_Bac2]MCU1718552.1 TorF family putative porin [Pseudomonas sp. 5P_3.1_Bac2]
MNKLLRLACASLCLAASAAAQAVTLNEDWSLDLNAALVSDYRFRGISQTLGDPALQGGATLQHSSGAYAGIWSSNVDFGSGSRTRQEIDYMLGYNWAIDDNLSLDLSYLHYEYTHQSSLKSDEAGFQFNAYGLYVGGFYTPNLNDNSSSYLYLGYQTELPYELGLNLRYGEVDFKDDVLERSNGKLRSRYNEWEVGLSKSLLSLDWSLSYVASDLSKSECYSYNGYDDLCAATVVLGVSKSF